ncbi:acetyltransferase [Parachaetomium inaequale]|uniref:Acetyltransferase n=1 Tax=Parachaetomium inaequale TaxID=2588326 RepID=A0AAN6P6Z3_9PEZI|nr:acetyltransferase [Parachaetomium inaequale]
MSKPTPNLSFRVATAEDLPLIHPLVESAYRGDESRLGWTTEADLLSGTRIDAEALLAKITDPAGAVLLATTTTTTPSQAPGGEEGKETLLACCEVVQRSTDTAYFGMFAVSPRQQGGGIGRRVLAHAEAHCRRAWGAQRLEMTVISSRRELLGWYARRGYRRTGEERPFPVEELAAQGGVVLVGDLRFVVLEKDLRAEVEME